MRWALITSAIGLLTTDRHTSIEKFLLETVGEFMCVVGGAWLGMKQNRRQLVR